MNENKERWINIEEVAEYIGVSPVTVRYWLRSGKKPGLEKGWGGSGVSESRILMNGSNQEKAISMIDRFFPLFPWERRLCLKKGRVFFAMKTMCLYPAGGSLSTMDIAIIRKY